MANFTTTLFIAFRESLEAIAVFVIVLTILKKRNAGKKVYISAYGGALLGTLVAIGEGILLHYLGSSFNENRIFNIVIQTIILIMVIYFIWWMIAEAKNLSGDIKEKYRKTTSLVVTTLLISFISFWREGTEVVSMTYGQLNIWGVIVGPIIGIIFGIFIYYMTTKISIGKVLYVLMFFLVLSTAPVFMKWLNLLCQGSDIYHINTDSNWGYRIAFPILRGFFGIKSHSTLVGVISQVTWDVGWISLLLIKNRKGKHGHKKTTQINNSKS